jgi:molybdopterin converting factor small subunit
MPVLHIPKQLRAYCGGTDFIELEGETVSELLTHLAVQFPELGSRVLDASGFLAPHLVFIQNDVVLRAGDVAEARVSAGDELRIFTAVSGG